VNTKNDLLEVLRWAQNELDHDLDETACCQRWCPACKARVTVPQWNKWNKACYNPLEAVLAGEDLKY
jgi:hypothetical protein